MYLASGGRGAWSANTIASTTWRSATSTVPTTSRPLSTSIEILVSPTSTCDFSLDWMQFNGVTRDGGAAHAAMMTRR